MDIYKLIKVHNVFLCQYNFKVYFMKFHSTDIVYIINLSYITGLCFLIFLIKIIFIPLLFTTITK